MEEIDVQNLPKHIAIIMDGNRRWAKDRGLTTKEGHKAGSKNLENIARFCNKIGIKYLTVYAFSTENWNRKQEEVDFLMELVAITMTNELAEMHDEGVQIRFIGDLTRLSDKLQKILNDAVETTKNNTGVVLQIALNYGARDEITNAIKTIVASGISADEVTPELISSNLYFVFMYSWNLTFLVLKKT
jgi:undecaprenyl diphosphate synthase